MNKIKLNKHSVKCSWETTRPSKEGLLCIEGHVCINSKPVYFKTNARNFHLKSLPKRSTSQMQGLTTNVSNDLSKELRWVF